MNGRRRPLHPPDIFRSPAEVLADTALTLEQKIEVLRRWEYDASELCVAEEEGMASRNDALLRQILLALKQLGAEISANRRPPTKQGGLDRQALKAARPSRWK